jgi:hypothetical protein
LHAVPFLVKENHQLCRWFEKACRYAQSRRSDKPPLWITTGTAGGYAWEDSRQFRYFGEFGERMGKTLQNRQGVV